MFWDLKKPETELLDPFFYHAMHDLSWEEKLGLCIFKTLNIFKNFPHGVPLNNDEIQVLTPKGIWLT